MRILLVVLRPAYLPNFQPVLRSLAERGHEVRVALQEEGERAPGQLAVVDDLGRAFPAVSRRMAPARADRWRWTATVLRRALDAVKHHEPLYAHSPHLRARARGRVPSEVRPLLGAHVLARPRARRLARHLLSRLEAALPVPDDVIDLLEEERPDVVVVTPLVSAGGSQTDFLRGAHRLGIPTAAWIYSWDNLTSKGAIHELPQRLVVWNDAQRREALELHRVPSERVVVTGAQAWDQWFGRRPSTSREAFAERVGLRADRPIILYLGSSGGGLGPEAPFVLRWVAAMRRSGLSRLEEAAVLVRPHPYAPADQWDALEGVGDGTVSVFPRGGEQPNTEQGRSDFFDSIHHSSAVAGVNTSAFIESAVVGRPVFSVPSPEFRLAQTGMPHFDYFLREGGGLLSLTDSLDRHLRDLDAALESEGDFADTRRRFLEAFVRPYGLDEPATPRVVASIEQMQGLSVASPPATCAGVLARLALEVLAGAHAFERAPARMRRRLRRRARRVLRRSASRATRRVRRRGRRSVRFLVRRLGR